MHKEEKEEDSNTHEDENDDKNTTKISENEHHKDSNEQEKASEVDSSYFNFLTCLFRIILENNKYQNWHEINDECESFDDDDDNQTIIDFYDWKGRVNLLNVKQLSIEIRFRAVKNKLESKSNSNSN